MHSPSVLARRCDMRNAVGRGGVLVRELAMLAPGVGGVSYELVSIEGAARPFVQMNRYHAARHKIDRRQGKATVKSKVQTMEALDSMHDDCRSSE